HQIERNPSKKLHLSHQQYKLLNQAHKIRFALKSSHSIHKTSLKDNSKNTRSDRNVVKGDAVMLCTSSVPGAHLVYSITHVSSLRLGLVMAITVRISRGCHLASPLLCCVLYIRRSSSPS
ncbi:hypothetical protein LOK49_Contig427G00002, partial [Camellia lanceoleosa]